MLMNKACRLTLLVAATFTLAACAPALRITLLPQPDGSASAVTVQNDKAQAVIDQPYAQGKVSSMGIQQGKTDATAVAKTYGQVLALQPAASHRYTLHFVTGTSDLLPESQAQLPAILGQAKALDGGEIIIAGHTDRVGDAARNDQLSRERALALRQIFVAAGFADYRVRAVGRGEREPLVPTADEVDEPANRRVEIVVR
ncbi:MAG: OmpA family protein [Brachymonas sp.]|jgi:OOP family OmpA-OmpF porin